MRRVLFAVLVSLVASVVSAQAVVVNPRALPPPNLTAAGVATYYGTVPVVAPIVVGLPTSAYATYPAMVPHYTVPPTVPAPVVQVMIQAPSYVQPFVPWTAPTPRVRTNCIATQVGRNTFTNCF